MTGMSVGVTLYGTPRLTLGRGLDGALAGVGTLQAGHTCWSAGLLLDESFAAAHSECYGGFY